MSIDREMFARAVRAPAPERVRLNIGGLESTYEYPILQGHISLMLSNVTWTPDSSDGDSSHGQAIGKLEIPQFYDRDLRDALLPTFLEGESGKKVLGIMNLEFYVTDNDWSYRQQPTGYHSSDSDSIADTFYNAHLMLKIGDRETKFELTNFYGDTRENGSRDDGYIDIIHKGDIYDAIYLLSAMPAEAWEAIWNTGKTDYVLAGYRLRKKDDGFISVTPDKRDSYTKKNPIVIVNRERVGAADVRIGSLKSQRRSG